MTRMPRVTGKKVVSALKSAGFIVVRVTGSHYHLYKPGSKLVTVPVHSGEVLSPMLLKSILEQAGMTVNELIDLL
ncbi:MAG: type II toxin-antitoxin system HicA family toxin [Eubacteriales bacterium]